MVMAGVSVLLALARALLYRNDPQTDPRVNQAERDLIRQGEEPAVESGKVLPFRRVWKNRRMKVFIFEHMLNAGADTIYVSTISSYFLEAHHIDITEAGLLVSLPLFGGALGGVFGGILKDTLIHFTGSRRRSRSIVGCTGKLMAAALMFYALAQGSPLGVAWGLFAIKFFSDWTQSTVWGTCTDIGGLLTLLVIGVLLDFYSETRMVDGQEVMAPTSCRCSSWSPR